jgi:hypothetical protein
MLPRTTLNVPSLPRLTVWVSGPHDNRVPPLGGHPVPGSSYKLNSKVFVPLTGAPVVLFNNLPCKDISLGTCAITTLTVKRNRTNTTNENLIKNNFNFSPI